MLYAIEKQSGVITPMPDEEKMGIALRDDTHWPVDDDGQPRNVQTIEGGHLVDGVPLNTWYRHVLYPEQQAILEPLWADGTVPQPPVDLMQTVTIQPMPDDAREDWQEWRKAEGLPAYGSGLFGMNWTVLALFGVAGYIAYDMFVSKPSEGDASTFDYLGE